MTYGQWLIKTPQSSGGRTHGGLIMWQDPIIKEIRELRNQYAAQFNYDLDAIFEDIKKRQEKLKRNRVSVLPAKPS